jgi:hypothetical protein
MDSREFDGITLVDWERGVHLDDVGLPGYGVTWCVDTDGQNTVWLVDRDALADGGDSVEHGNANQPHEQLGPLPSIWLHRVALAQYRCGQPRVDGRPCRQAVRGPGRTCGWHSERASAS